MRSSLIGILLLFFAGVASAGEALFDELWQEPEKKKQVKEGIAILKRYFKAEAQVLGGRMKAMGDQNDALQDFLEWLDSTEESLGVDLRSKPWTVVEVFDRGRVDTLSKPRMRGPKIGYYRDDDPRGIERFEYSILIPKTYKAGNDERYPLVISLHARVINAKHPAFRGKDINERSRLAVFNNWLKTEVAESAIVIAPTGNPNGFTFEKDPESDRHVLYLAVGAGLSKYRVDWRRVFLEVHGSALRVCCEQTFMFAGFIVRERVDDRRRPLVQEEEHFILDNLNGAPLCYVADEARWEKVGKPTTEALTKAYAKAGMLQNLVILKGKRDANGAIAVDEAKIAAFVRDHTLPLERKKFTWRFANPAMTAPMPVLITGANFYYDEDAPLEKAAGLMKFEIRQESYKDEKGNELPCNVIDIEISEAESLDVGLHDGLVDLSLPVTVRVNGKVVEDKVSVRRDWGQFVKRILPRRFFMIPYVGRVICQFESKPQYVPPKKPDEEKEAGKEEKKVEEQAVKDKEAAANPGDGK
jgi:hypothetical protein